MITVVDWFIKVKIPPLIGAGVDDIDDIIEAEEELTVSDASEHDEALRSYPS